VSGVLWAREEGKVGIFLAVGRVWGVNFCIDRLLIDI